MRPEPQRLVDRREFPILYVDDEKENLRAFELTFRREYEVHTAESGREALEIINSHPIAVVLSDHRMPEMTGTEFLNRVRTLDPRTIRLLVTAYGDAETLADAVNNGSIYRYIPKPWNLDEMRQVLSQAVDLYALESERESLLSELTTLRSVSHELAAELDLGRLCGLVVDTVVSELGFDAATLMMFSESCSHLTTQAALPARSSEHEFLTGLHVDRPSGGEWFELILAGQTQLLTPDRVEGSNSIGKQLISATAADEVLCVPLPSARGVIGALLVDNRRGGRQFQAAERVLLEGLAAQVGIALDNALVVDSRRAFVLESDIDELATLGAAILALGERESLPIGVRKAIKMSLEQEGSGRSERKRDLAEIVPSIADELSAANEALSARDRIDASVSGHVNDQEPFCLALTLILAGLCKASAPSETIEVAGTLPGELSLSTRLTEARDSGGHTGLSGCLWVAAANVLLFRVGYQLTATISGSHAEFKISTMLAG